MELRGPVAIAAIAIMIAVLYAGSTLLTPLYVIYKQHFGFSQITLTLIYAVYVVGNLTALLLGRVSDALSRRRIALPAATIAIASTLVFLFAQGTVALYVGRVLSGPWQRWTLSSSTRRISRSMTPVYAGRSCWRSATKSPVG